MRVQALQGIMWYGLLTAGSLVVPIRGGAQTSTAQAPRATVRELATIEGDVTGWYKVPNGRILLYTVNDSTFAYDILTKHRALLGTDMHLASVSPQGDRLAFSRSSEDHKGIFLWTMPIDPKTGTASGPAQRVSLEGDGFLRTGAMFSPDGKTLAYTAGPQPDRTFNVTLVSATGGPERAVANYPRRVLSGWSGDGKWLYVEIHGDGREADRHRIYIERVPAAGGRSEVLFPIHSVLKDWFENVVGVSPDGRVAFYMRNPDQFFYMTASGATGEITVPLPPLDDGWGYDFALDSMRYVTMSQTLDQRVHVLDLATGQVRDLLPPDVQSISPAWSPDGRRLAVRSGNVSDYAITVMNAGGSGQRRYPVALDLREHQDAGSQMLWSPDGRLLAFKADAGQKLALLDVISGQTRILARSPGEGIGDFVWRSDGTAIVTSRLRERTPPWGLRISRSG